MSQKKTQDAKGREIGLSLLWMGLLLQQGLSTIHGAFVTHICWCVYTYILIGYSIIVISLVACVCVWWSCYIVGLFRSCCSL